MTVDLLADDPVSIVEPMLRNAVISFDGRYRYVLERRWDQCRPTMTVIGLNPSTADAEHDDPTTRRVIGFARAASCGAVRLINLCAWRATTPATLRTVPDPIGPDNDRWLLDTISAADLVVAAWGTHAHPDRVNAVQAMLRHRTVFCLGLTRDGHPRHPLFVPAAARLQLYSTARHDWGPWTPVPDDGDADGGELVERFCPCGADQIEPADLLGGHPGTTR